jgi:hypothetical protein
MEVFNGSQLTYGPQQSANPSQLQPTRHALDVKHERTITMPCC